MLRNLEIFRVDVRLIWFNDITGLEVQLVINHRNIIFQFQL
uniref:Uncharacterized protein n=1 Tax=Anguilla anguilla TaxID=7936 RepID=A0A0E9R5J8_ANGAN